MKIVIHPDYEHCRSWIENIHDNFINSGTVIKAERNKIKRSDINGIDAIIKAYKIPNAIQSFIYGHIRASKAQRSFNYSITFNNLGINNPKAIAYVEFTTLGCVRQSYYICENWKHDCNLSEYFAQNTIESHDKLIPSLINFTFKQHKHNIFHQDYNPSNILIRIKNNLPSEFAIIDFNRMKFTKPTVKKCAESLVHLSYDNHMRNKIAIEYAKRFGVDESFFSILLQKEQKKMKRSRSKILKFKKIFSKKRY